MAIERAAALCELGRFAEALEALQLVVASDAENADAWCLMAQARLCLGDPGGSYEAAGVASSLAPEYDWPHRLASAALSGLARHSQAADAARQAVEIAPDSWQAHACVARALTHPRSMPPELEEAARAAARAVSLAPDEAETQMTAGAVAKAAGHRKEAGAAYRRALEIDPQNSAAHHELASLNLRKSRLHAAEAGRLADAASGFANAVRTDPRAASSRRVLDGLLRLFISRTAYFIFLDAFLVARLSAHSTHLPIRLLAVAALLLPAAFALRFVLRLSPTLRPYLLRLLIAPGIRLAAAAEAIAIAALLACPFVAEASRRDVAGVAATAALAGRLLLYRARRRAAARA
jgi:tetratricopeptide (TPR) repeat protein